MASQSDDNGPYDLVIAGARAIDPETGLDAIRDIGVKGGRIAAISERPLSGATRLDTEGLVAAPGFIDMHAHGQQLPAAWIQAFDGVTTALELELGMLPIGAFYADVAKEGRPINYGAAVSWVYARIEAKERITAEPTILWFQKAFSRQGWQNTLATPEELEAIIDKVEAGLKEGGLGVGINAGYAPGYGRREYHELARLAARYDTPTYTHVRYMSAKEPQSAFESLEELVALSAATGAHMHICHLNSSSGRDVVACAELIRGAQSRGLPITTEAYPYGAASTAIGAALLRGPDWLERCGANSADNIELNGRKLTQEKIDELQASQPGAVIVLHFLRPDDDARDRDLMDLSVLYPGAPIASDAMPWGYANGRLVEGDVWPLPEDAFSHPRSAGCFSRFIARWVRERKAISLIEALRKTSLLPAQILERATPQMRKKGRLQVGADADIVVFDLATIQDRATFVAPSRLSQGMRHVVVNGEPIIRDGERIADARPGRPIRRPV